MSRIRETPSLVRLDRRATLLHRLSVNSWDELPGGVIRVGMRSPQFGLCGYCDELINLATREGYSVSIDGPQVWLFRNNEWRKSHQFLVFTPKQGE